MNRLNVNRPVLNGSWPLGVPFRFDSVPLLWTVEKVYSEAECEQFIDMIEQEDPCLATNNPMHRNQDRFMKDDHGLADQLFERIKHSLPNQIGNLKLDRLNERFRFYRYKHGQDFKAHMDHWYQPSDSEITLFTVIAYFNGNFIGVETRFMEQLEETVVPEPGRVAIFQHKVRHEGCRVRSGIKYAVRTEVIYRLESGSEFQG